MPSDDHEYVTAYIPKNLRSLLDDQYTVQRMVNQQLF